MFIVIGTCPHCGHATVCDPAWLQLIRSEGKGFANLGGCGDCDQCGFHQHEYHVRAAFLL